jgi:N-acetylmuramoyl-L-alanine amidase
MIDFTAWRRVALAALMAVSVGAGRAPAEDTVAAGQAAPPPADSAAAPAASPSDAPYMLDARVVGDGSRVRFIADVSSPVDMAVFPLADPYRIVIDLPEMRFVMPDGVGSQGRGLISAFRYGLISAGKSRIVIDLTGPVAIDRQFAVPAADGQPARLVVDLVPTTRDKFLAAAKDYRDSHEAATAQQPAAPLASGSDSRPLIVLDPGHGGIDYGAHGVSGSDEKDVVLAFAKVLGAKLTATNRYRVIYTRSDDTFVSLGGRVDIARQNHAALFVSIHANSFPDGQIRGTTVYTVSDKASDKAAADLANAENQSDELAGIDSSSEDSDQVKDILADLTRRETHNFGLVFAQTLVKNLGLTTKMFKVPHQEASFKVLEAPDVPSALIELGYITNAADEKELNSPDWQASTAGAMVTAIDNFFGQQTAASANP